MTKQNKISKLIPFSLISIVVGLVSIFIKSLNPGSVASDGTLVEPLFFLLPIGFLFIFVGILTCVFALIKLTLRKK